MAKTLEKQLPVRKNFLIGGAAVIGVALLLFIVSRFVGGGGGGIESPPVDTTGTATQTSAPSTVQQPEPSKAPTNKLNGGGRDPFASRAGAAPAPVKTPAPDTTTVAAPDATTAHTWQLLDLKGNDATFLVDGKKVAGKALKAEIVTGYTYNSVTNATCVTVLHDAKAFALCSGAAPFPA